MTKVKLNELMKEYNILPSELDDVFAFVTDLLYLRRRELEENESYATRTIDEIYRAEVQVDDLINYVSELEDEDEDC